MCLQQVVQCIDVNACVIFDRRLSVVRCKTRPLASSAAYDDIAASTATLLGGPSSIASSSGSVLGGGLGGSGGLRVRPDSALSVRSNSSQSLLDLLRNETATRPPSPARSTNARKIHPEGRLNPVTFDGEAGGVAPSLRLLPAAIDFGLVDLATTLRYCAEVGGCSVSLLVYMYARPVCVDV